MFALDLLIFTSQLIHLPTPYIFMKKNNDKDGRRVEEEGQKGGDSKKMKKNVLFTI